MPDRAALEALSKTELVELVLHLQERITRLEEILEAQRAEIEDLKRRGARQATPFSKGKPKRHPKKPGRRPGEGPFSRRVAPDWERDVRAAARVPLTHRCCPDCGGVLEREAPELVTRTELPADPAPVITAALLARARCRACGRRVRATHGAFPADQRGATAHRVGPHLKAVAHWLHYGLGLPVRKVRSSSRNSSASRSRKAPSRRTPWIGRARRSTPATRD